MSDLFKSALGYFSNSSVPGQGNEFIGQLIEIGNVKLRVKQLIAEGGFGFVFVAQDVATGKEYALKRLIAGDEAANEAIQAEIAILKRVSGHPHIIQFLTASFVDKAKSGHGRPEYLIVTELCTGGSLVDVLTLRQGVPLGSNIVLQVFQQTCLAVQHLHGQQPPVTHRDLKIENLLLSTEGTVKLCDFGSATTETFQPDVTWSANQRTLLEETMARYTTPMYRAPEMVDTWSDHAIGPASDVWALGCVLYTLCFMRHPFEDSAKLAILNANFAMPAGDASHACFNQLIRGCLQADPCQRLSISQVLERLTQIAATQQVDLSQPLRLDGKRLDSQPQNNAGQSVGPATPPPRPRAPPPDHQATPPPRPRPPPTEQQATPPGGGGGLFSSIRGGAGSFLKNLKDTSSKVMQSVQQSIARTDLDLSYVTSRLVVMPFPAEGLEAAYRSNHADDVRALLEARHPGGYAVYNVSGRAASRATRLGARRQLDCGWAATSFAPTLQALLALCGDICDYLGHEERGVAVIHCTGGGCSSALVVCAVLLYCRLFARPEDALQMFAVKRWPPALQPSQMRYLYYLSRVLRSAGPHAHPVTLVSVTLAPVPMFTKLRSGCRPYVEVWQGDELRLTTLKDYDRMRLFEITDGRVTLPLNVTVLGDVTVVVYHARHQLGRATGIKVAQLQFHTGFIDVEETALRFSRSELDEPAEPEHYPERFNAIVNVFVSDEEKEPWFSPDCSRISSDILFSTPLEKEETFDTFVCRPVGVMGTPSRAPMRPPPPVPPPPVKQYRDEEDETKPRHFPAAPAKRDLRMDEPAADLLSVGDLLGDLGAPSVPSQGNLLADLAAPSSGNRQSSTLIGDLSAPSMPPPAASQQSSNLLGDLSAPPTNHQSSSLVGDLAAPSMPASGSQQSSNLFDLFGGDDVTQNVSGGGPLLAPVAPSIPRNASTPNLEARSRDPFADIGALGNSLNVGWAGGSKPTSPRGGSPTSPRRFPAGTPTRSPVAADYSRTHFEPRLDTAAGSARGSGDVFGDLLGSQGYEFASVKKDLGPRTINQMRHVELAKEMDPDRLKVLGWTDGRQGNIRALLCSVHTVLWTGAKWTRVDMSQLVTPGEVKKSYRRACLAVHPDKQMGTENENIAKLLFMELNNAWTEFENDATQQQLFS